MKTNFWLFSCIFIIVFGSIQKNLAQGPYSNSGNWLELDGVDDYASIADNPSLDVGNGPNDDFTVECFFYIPDLNGTGIKTLLIKNKSYYLYLIFSTTEKDRIIYRIDYAITNSNLYTYYFIDFSMGWHHIAASYDNEYTTNEDALQIFLDGTRVINAGGYDITPGIYNSNSIFTVGGYYGINMYSGKIDEVRISDVLRYGATYTVPTEDFTIDSNTRALWHFNELSGTTLFQDATTNENTLVGNGGAAVLPVQLTSFTATIFGSHVQLSWSTATEMNNYGFSIERKEDEVWNNIGFVNGDGTTNEPNKYSFTDKNLPPGKYEYRLKQSDMDGEFTYSESVEVIMDDQPKVFKLSQNYPNPFNPETEIAYQIPVAQHVSLVIYDSNGRLIQILEDKKKEAGIYTVNWNGRDNYGSIVPSGIYLYRLLTEKFSKTGKAILIR